MHAVRRRALAVLALLLVALTLGATGGSQYFCRPMGRVMDHCCCRAAKVAEAAAARVGGAEIRAKDCCDRVDRAAGDAVPAVREAVPSLDSPVVATLGPVLGVVAEPAIRMLGAKPVGARAPPRPGGPIF